MKGDGWNALRTSMAEDTASAKGDCQDVLYMGMAEDTASAYLWRCPPGGIGAWMLSINLYVFDQRGRRNQLGSRFNV